VANSGLPGELAQILPTPAHFEQASELVTPEALAGSFACGPDPEVHVDAIQQYVDAGYDEIYVGHVGPGHDAFLEFYARVILPRFA
jgi:hypothetical protein